LDQIDLLHGEKGTFLFVKVEKHSFFTSKPDDFVPLVLLSHDRHIRIAAVHHQNHHYHTGIHPAGCDGRHGDYDGRYDSNRFGCRGDDRNNRYCCC